jgi:hypothetical protein
MKRMGLLAGVLLAASVAAAQGAGDAAWVGVWHSELDGLPGATLTLGNDSGQLGGTIVLNMISSKEGAPRIIGSETHVLLDTHMDGSTLSFHVKRNRGPNDRMEFSVILTPRGTAKLHCTNCNGAPVVEFEKTGIR